MTTFTPTLRQSFIVAKGGSPAQQIPYTELAARLLFHERKVAMDVKEAVKIAAGYVASLEGMAGGNNEGATNEQILRDIRFAVEGTRYDEQSGSWSIDVGFARAWDQASSSPLAGLAGSLKDNRTFKTVAIDDATGRILAYGGN